MTGAVRLIELGPNLLAHACGALWLPDERTALVADVHLGYGWAQRRRGQLGPVEDTSTLPKLEALLEELHPQQLVILGDVVHAPRPAPAERALVEAAIQQLSTKAELTLVLGNHDRGFMRDYPELPIRVCRTWSAAGLLAVHGDRPAGIPVEGITALGHLHPALGIMDDAGASQRIPVFLISPRAVVLPAWSPYAAGFDVRRSIPKEVGAVLGPGEVEVIAATGKRLVRVGPLALIRAKSP